MSRFSNTPQLHLAPELEQEFQGADAFDRIMAIQGTIFRKLEHRTTCDFFIGTRRYFVKQHFGYGWKELFIDLFRGVIPVTGAGVEWNALRRLEALQIPTTPPLGFGQRGWNPASRKSFLITAALEHMIPVKEVFQRALRLSSPQGERLQRALITRIAQIARSLHRDGINHRDFYLDHFLVPERDWSTWTASEPLSIHLIDLHRAQIRRKVPRRWLIKDLGALLFSALDCPLTLKDILRFLRHYLGSEWRHQLRTQSAFWKAVMKRAVRMYRGFHGTPPQLPGFLSSFA